MPSRWVNTLCGIEPQIINDSTFIFYSKNSFESNVLF